MPPTTPYITRSCAQSKLEIESRGGGTLLAGDANFGVRSEEVYLKAYADGRDARAGIGEYLSFYNTQRPHQALGYRTPGEVFISGSGGNVVTSPMTSTQGSKRAVHDLILASYLSS